MNCLVKRSVSIVGSLLLVFCFSLCSRSLAQVKPASTSCPDCDSTSSDYEKCRPASAQEQKAEQYVLQKVLAAESATREQYLNQDKARKPEDFVLRGCFISSLLTKKLGIPHTGITIARATVNGPIDLRNEEVNVRVKLIGCKFQDDFNMQRSHFSGGLLFSGSSFHVLDAECARIDFDFGLDHCIFEHCPPFLKNLNVGVDLSLVGAKFSGPVDFTGAVIKNNFLANDPSTEFCGADFEGVRVGLDTSLSGAKFAGFVNFGNAEFNSLSIQDTIFNGDVNFKSTRIHDFYLGKSPAERFKGRLAIEDLTFSYMSPQDWNELKTFAEKSNTGVNQAGQDLSNSAQFYASLEDLFRTHGHSDDADMIYVTWKLRESKDPHLAWSSKVWSRIQYKLAGYGRQKEWLLVWCLPFLVAGLIAFHPRFMEVREELRDKNDPTRYQNRYCLALYSLDLFIPIVELGYKDIWTPRAILSRIYKPIHIIVGNLLVPIGLAAWLGIIK